jgi:hypothetical protein
MSSLFLVLLVRLCSQLRLSYFRLLVVGSIFTDDRVLCDVNDPLLWQPDFSSSRERSIDEFDMRAAWFNPRLSMYPKA